METNERNKRSANTHSKCALKMESEHRINVWKFIHKFIEATSMMLLGNKKKSDVRSLSLSHVVNGLITPKWLPYTHLNIQLC